MNPKYPVFVPTKGRWESLLTIKAFEKLDIPYQAVVEKQEYAAGPACMVFDTAHVLASS